MSHASAFGAYIPINQDKQGYTISVEHGSLKRGAGRVRGESAFDQAEKVRGIEHITAQEPSPEFAAVFVFSQEGFRGDDVGHHLSVQGVDDGQRA